MPPQPGRDQTAPDARRQRYTTAATISTTLPSELHRATPVVTDNLVYVRMIVLFRQLLNL